jgi:hypothetical protein
MSKKELKVEVKVKVEGSSSSSKMLGKRPRAIVVTPTTPTTPPQKTPPARSKTPPAPKKPRTKSPKTPKTPTTPKTPRAKTPKTPKAPKKKKPTTPRKPRAKKPVTWWGPEQDGKNPLKDYIPPSSDLRVSEPLEQAYKFMLSIPRHMTAKRYDMIQCARRYYHDKGECPFYLNDMMH